MTEIFSLFSTVSPIRILKLSNGVLAEAANGMAISNQMEHPKDFVDKPG